MRELRGNKPMQAQNKPDLRKYRLGLIGYPLEHSLSPRLHQAALRVCKLEGEYRLYPLAPGSECEKRLRRLLEQMRSGEIDGLNVTIPHKQAVLPYMDELRPGARAIGAVNTIIARDGRLIGENTDAAGFLADLTLQMGHSSPTQVGQQPGKKEALVLGAGGAARAVVFALAEAGWKVWVAARRMEQAEALATALKMQAIEVTAVPLEDSALAELSASRRISLLVNATPVGMSPWVNACPWPVGIPLPQQAFVYDLVYNPAETCLLGEAKRAKLGHANGLGMLINQAALAFELWTGCKPARQALEQAVSEALSPPGDAGSEPSPTAQRKG